MKYEFRNEAGTIIAASSDDESHVVILEPGCDGFEEAAAMATASVAPPAPDPIEAERAAMVCSRFQAKAAMLQAGVLLKVEAEVAMASDLAKLAWAEAVEFRRDSPLINSLAAAVGLSDAQIDDLFRAAMNISA